MYSSLVVAVAVAECSLGLEVCPTLFLNHAGAKSMDNKPFNRVDGIKLRIVNLVNSELQVFGIIVSIVS